MNGKTAGQLAYEAAVRVMLDGDTAADRVPDDGPDFAWDAIGSLERNSWEAAATAVETEQLRLAREDRDQLRKRVLDLAAELLEEAHATPSRSEFEIKQDITVRIRKALDL